MTRKLLYLAIAAVMAWTPVARGDGETRTKRPHATPNEASDASFDKRLPPVLPGEEVNDSGNTMKVWSTAGPVPKQHEDKQHCQGCGDADLPISVIVDPRGRPYHDQPGVTPPNPQQPDTPPRGGGPNRPFSRR